MCARARLSGRSDDRHISYMPRSAVVTLTLSCLLGLALGEEAPTTLANGEAQTAWLDSASYAYFSVALPSVAALPLNLALTSLAGNVGLFASTTSPIPDSSSATWTIPRNGDGHLTIQAFHSLVHSGAECNSDDQALGEPGAFADAEACAAACAAQDGCSYFIFGTGSKAGDCYWEKTSSSACTEGWESDEFDFYSVARGSTTLYVGVLAYSSTSFSISAQWGDVPSRLVDGTPQEGSVGAGGAVDYIVRAPGGASDLSLALTMRTGDADMYVGTGGAPSSASATWSVRSPPPCARTPTRTRLPSNPPHHVPSSPLATPRAPFVLQAATEGDDALLIRHDDRSKCESCDYHVRIVPHAGADAAFTLTASSTDVITLLSDGVPAEAFVGAGQTRHYRLLVPHERADVQVVMTRLSGNPDMFVSLTDERPTAATATWSSTDAEGDIVLIAHTDEHLAACLSDAVAQQGASGGHRGGDGDDRRGAGFCTVYVAVYGAAAESTFALVGDARPVGAGFHVDQPQPLAGDYAFALSTFGAPLPVEPLSARIVRANPPTACPPEGASDDWVPTNAAELSGNIALIDRGGSCPYPGRYFANKVMQAQRAGATAVVMAESDPAADPSRLVSMGAASGDLAAQVSIPSVFVSYATGQALVGQLSNGLRATLQQPSERMPLLVTGHPMAGAAVANQIQYYELWTGSVPTTLTITVAARFGNPDVLVSATGAMPTTASATWRSTTEGSETLVIEASDELQVANGRYVVGVMAAGGVSTSYTITAASESTMIALQSNVPLPAQRVAKRAYKYYRAWVDSSADAVTVAITVNTGDADLYVSFDNPRVTAADATWSARGRTNCATVDCGNTIQNGDAIHISRDHEAFCKTSPCVAYVAVYGSEDTVFSALVTTSDAGQEAAPALLDGQPQQTAIEHAGHYAYFTYFVPAAAARVTFTVEAAQGDPDLYVGMDQGAAAKFPTRETYAYRSAAGAGEVLTVTTADNKACVACTYRLAVYAWSADVRFSITASAALDAVAQGDGVAPHGTSSGTATLALGVPMPVAVGPTADARLYYRYTLVERRPFKLSFEKADGTSETPWVQARFGDKPRAAVEGVGDKDGVAAVADVDEAHFGSTSFSPGRLHSLCPELPCHLFVAVAADGAAVRGALLVSNDGGGGAGGGAGTFFLVLFLLSLVGGAYYFYLVRQNKRNFSNDMAALSAKVGAAKAGVASLMGTGKRSGMNRGTRLSGGDNLVAPLSTSSYVAPSADALAPLEPDGTARGMRPSRLPKDDPHFVDMEE